MFIQMMQRKVNCMLHFGVVASLCSSKLNSQQPSPTKPHLLCQQSTLPPTGLKQLKHHIHTWLKSEHQYLTHPLINCCLDFLSDLGYLVFTRYAAFPSEWHLSFILVFYRHRKSVQQFVHHCTQWICAPWHWRCEKREMESQLHFERFFCDVNSVLGYL